jgi:hypothetical protein
LIVSDDVAKKSYHLSILMIKCQMQKHPQVWSKWKIITRKKGW